MQVSVSLYEFSDFCREKCNLLHKKHLLSSYCFQATLLNDK